MLEVPSLYRGHKLLALRLYFYYKDQYLLLIHKYRTIFCLYRLLPQINVHKDMRTALFCVVCILPFFIICSIAVSHQLYKTFST